MTDKEKLYAIRAEIHRLVDIRGYDREMANDLFAFMDSLPDEYVSDTQSTVVLYGLTGSVGSPKEESVSEIDFEQELYKAFGQVKDFTLGMQIAKRFYEMGKNNQEHISEELEEAMQHNAPDNIGIDDLLYWRNGFITCANWQKTKDESITDDLGEYINKISKQFPEVSFAKLSRIAVRVAKWQKEHICKPADGDDLPKIDREVIALLDNGKVVFAHRPPEYWDGKDIVTGKVTRHYPKTYDKGGWNIPNVKWWLDVYKLPNVEE